MRHARKLLDWCTAVYQDEFFWMNAFLLALAGTAVVLLWLVVRASGPALPPPGLVVDKRFMPAHTDTMMMPMIISDGQTTTVLMLPYAVQEPDRWAVAVEPYDAAGAAQPVVWTNVTRPVYDAVQVGAWYAPTPQDIDLAKSRKVQK